eukprot:Nitzschia sp. Nitz4//scaffold169_size48518//37169//39016//NITZ4_007079-RA/size48518-processed-gene-0.82-mRNA-1//1//CDS//3329538409//7808//frame0
MTNRSLGLTIDVSPDTLERLRQPSKSGSAPKALTVLSGSSANSSQHAENASPGFPIPGVAINLEGLVGYRPSSNEVDSIRGQLLSAMWSRYLQSRDNGQLSVNDSEIDQSVVPPPDFDAQVTEFYNSGVAKFLHDGSSHDMDQHVFSIQYPPELVLLPSGALVRTSKLWEQFHQEQSTVPQFDSLKSLWTCLRDCSRGIVWKRDMAVELAALIRQEQARLDYIEWTESTRQAKLDNLYNIRETLVHQVELAKHKVRSLEGEREELVQDALEPHRRRLQASRSGDRAFGAFGTTDLSFPDEFQWLGIHDDRGNSDEEDDWGLDDEDGYSSFSDSNSESNESIPQAEDTAPVANEAQDAVSSQNSKTSDTNGVTDITFPNGDSLPANSLAPDSIVTNPLSSPFERRKERMQKARAQKKKERLARLENARKEELLQLENDLRSKFTTRDLVFSQATANALEKKMENVEELLESLQDEVWKAEEDAEAEDASILERTDQEDELSLLDQVLAMILGAMPRGSTDEDPATHFVNMQALHKEIVKAWKSKFGRLPPPAGRIGVARDVEGTTIFSESIASTNMSTDIGDTTTRRHDINRLSPSMGNEKSFSEHEVPDDWEELC